LRRSVAIAICLSSTLLGGEWGLESASVAALARISTLSGLRKLATA
jgi:hypothetical protein